MSSRYTRYLHIQPPRAISLSVLDVYHIVKGNERVDQLAGKYYENMELGYIIMYANPEFWNEHEVKQGNILRIPMPLSRVFREWGLNAEF